MLYKFSKLEGCRVFRLKVLWFKFQGFRFKIELLRLRVMCNSSIVLELLRF
jgi:hypothetical protein